MFKSGKPILCLNFDGVCHMYTSGWHGAAVIPDGCVPGLVEFLDSAIKKFTVAIYSSRSSQPGGIDAMKGALRMWICAAVDDKSDAEHIFNAIYWPTEKPPALVTLDDRAITFTGVWPDVAELLKFSPWNRKLPMAKVLATSYIMDSPTTNWSNALPPIKPKSV